MVVCEEGDSLVVGGRAWSIGMEPIAGLCGGHPKVTLACGEPRSC